MGNSLAPDIGLENTFDYKKAITVFFKEYKRSYVRSTLRFDSRRALRLSVTHSNDMTPLYGGICEEIGPEDPFDVPSLSSKNAYCFGALVVEGDVIRTGSSAYVEYTLLFYVLNHERSIVKHVKKRYRQLDHLNSVIMHNIGDFEGLSFPTKKVFGNLSPQLIESRIGKLNLWLLDVISLPGIFKFNDGMLLKFFEVDSLFKPKQVLPMADAFRRALMHSFAALKPDYLIPYPITSFECTIKRITLDIVHKEYTPIVVKAFSEGRKFPKGAIKDYLLKAEAFSENFAEELHQRLKSTSEVTKKDSVEEIVEIERFEEATGEFWDSLVISLSEGGSSRATSDESNSEASGSECAELVENCHISSELLLNFWLEACDGLFRAINTAFASLEREHNLLTPDRKMNPRKANEIYGEKSGNVIAALEEEIHRHAMGIIANLSEKEEKKFDYGHSEESSPFFGIRTTIMLFFDFVFVFLASLKRTHALLSDFATHVDAEVALLRKRGTKLNKAASTGVADHVLETGLNSVFRGNNEILIEFTYKKKKNFVRDVMDSGISFSKRHTFYEQMVSLVSDILSAVFAASIETIDLKDDKQVDYDYFIHTQDKPAELSLQDLHFMISRIELNTYQYLLNACSRRIFTLGKYLYFEGVVRLHRILCSGVIYNNVMETESAQGSTLNISISLSEDLLRVHLLPYIHNFERKFDLMRTNKIVD